MPGLPTNPSLLTRKMRKNFAGLIVAILAGILVCFALANLVLLADQQQKHDDINNSVTGRSASERAPVSFRSLHSKGTKKAGGAAGHKTGDAYSLQTNHHMMSNR
jgi:mannitol-specific phosphotransferase system IIBC component